MATADAAGRAPQDRATRSRWWLAALALPIVVAVVVAVVVSRSPGSLEGTNGIPSTLPTVVIEASSPSVASTLPELVAASDLVVRGTVVQTGKGRLVGGGDPTDPAGGAVLSRLVTVRVDEVLGGRGPAPAVGATVLVEEEGWLTDARPISVNGAPVTATGDEVVWFLQAVQDPELDGFVGVGTQGRFLLRPGDAVVGPDHDDPLAASIERGGADALLAQLRASAAR